MDTNFLSDIYFTILFSGHYVEFSECRCQEELTWY